MNKQEADMISNPIGLLSPNKYVNYEYGDLVYEYSDEICAGIISYIDKTDAIFKEVSAYKYDREKAEDIASGKIKGYIPDLTQIITSGKGICFDKAALMVAMLRTQHILARLCMGNAKGIYHAWVEVRISGKFEVYDPTWKISLYKRPLSKLFHKKEYIAEKYH